MTKEITKVQIHDSTLYYADCWDVFDEIDKVDIVITDPPYGKNICKTGKYRNQPLPMKGSEKPIGFIDYGPQLWDQKLTKKYFTKIKQLSINAIIFGGNFYSDYLPASSCWFVWDKQKNCQSYSDCELIWTSFDGPIKKISFKWNGFLQADMKNKEKRVHPTQKPEYVMKWIVANYTKETDLVLDPFMGSGTTGVACALGKRRFIGVEKEKQYFDIACERIEWAYRKMRLF